MMKIQVGTVTVDNGPGLAVGIVMGATAMSIFLGFLNVSIMWGENEEEKE